MNFYILLVSEILDFHIAKKKNLKTKIWRMEYRKYILMYYLGFKHLKLIICQTPYTLALYIRFFICYKL